MLSFLLFLASSIMLTPFFFMVVLSWVASIVDPFDTILCTLKMFLTDWGTYSTSLSFAFYPTCIFMITKPLSSTSSYDHFPLSHLSHIFRHISWIYPCLLCVMTHRSLPNIIQDIRPCHLLAIMHIMWLPQRGCWLRSLSLSWPNNQQPCVLFFHSFCILRWSGFFCYSCFRFCCCLLYFCFPNNMMLCGHICHTCCTRPLINLHSFLFIFSGV